MAGFLRSKIPAEFQRNEIIAETVVTHYEEHHTNINYFANYIKL
jgi:hypothetical protein